eukprot:5230774-Ditylum_brightwellii.AAC.1
MSEETPPMTSPLVDHLGYTGITDYADEILQGTAQHLDGVDKYTQLYLDQFFAVDGIVETKAKPVPFSQYKNKVRRLREHTSSGPTDLSPAMIKTE